MGVTVEYPGTKEGAFGLKMLLVSRVSLLLFFVLATTVVNTVAAFSVGRPSKWSTKRHILPLQAVSSEAVATATTTPLPPAISIENLSCSHNGEVFQLDDVSYVLSRGSRMGLVGRNGCGKSTLLRILAEACCTDTSVSTADEGVVYTGKVTTPRNVRVAFVEQEPPMPSDVTVADALLGVVSSSNTNDIDGGGTSVYDVVRRYRLAVQNAEQDPDDFAAASADMDNVGGWSVLQKAEEIATRLRVRHLQEQPLSSLSGGERKRVALAAALVQEPDVLLLDEPTNHLSLAAIRWLSDLLTDNQRKLTVLVVTHDRAFLEDVCTGILELDQGSLYSYEGSYAAYLEGKEARLALQDAAVQAAKAKYRVELDWMRRQPQARESKSKARIDAFYKLEKATKPRASDPSLTLSADGQRRVGGNILTMKDVSLKFGDRVMLDKFSYEFCRGDKIGIVGSNGVGKTTLIRVLSGAQAIDDGKIDVGETIVLGVYDQMGLDVDEDQKVMDFVTERVKTRDGASMAEAPNEARKLLNQFEFPRQRWQERISMLSGGEKRRLQLLSVLSTRPNFLILDEPSNDIDLNTLTALESYLQEFNGVLVVVSHDRFFTDKVTKHLFVMEGNGVIKDYMGTLSEYAECLVEQESAGPNSPDSSSVNVGSPADKKTAYKQDRQKRNEQRNAVRKWKKEINTLESSMEKLKQQAADLQREIDNSSDEGWTVLAELTEKLQKINEEIEEKELRWLEVAELLEEADDD